MGIFSIILLPFKLITSGLQIVMLYYICHLLIEVINLLKNNQGWSKLTALLKFLGGQTILPIKLITTILNLLK